MKTRALAAALALAAAACGAANTQTSSATTTGAELSADDLYPAPRANKPCANAARGVDFAPGSSEITPAERRNLDAWAGCLNEPTMRPATVVVNGTIDPTEPNALFRRRGEAIRDALVMRGVDARRIVVAGDGRQGPRADGAMKLDFTTSVTPRAVAPKDPAVRPAVR